MAITGVWRQTREGIDMKSEVHSRQVHIQTAGDLKIITESTMTYHADWEIASHCHN